MSYRDILLVRKEARGWRLEDMGGGGEEPAGTSPPLDPELMEGVEEGDPGVRVMRALTEHIIMFQATRVV